MSEQTIALVKERFLSQVETASAEGRGAELLDQLVRDLAADCASFVFLQMQGRLATLSDEDDEDALGSFLNWASEFPARIGNSFVDATLTTLTAFGANSDQLADVEKVAASAFQEKLTRLLEQSQTGGSA